jgi:NADPH:quinone reductase-like Zn-dependent oxidoreductase
MKAIVYERYGSPDVLRLRDVDKPAVTDDGVLVRIRAASANPYDWHFMRGKPYFTRLMFGLLKPKAHGLGADLAGEVEAVGKSVTRFRPGDSVFGEGAGAFAEYAAVPERWLARGGGVKSCDHTVSRSQAVRISLAALPLCAQSARRDVDPGARLLLIPHRLASRAHPRSLVRT